ncbi:MAG: TerB family tellurite resistance protein [Halofilum sp. (in: g-proteobacteria)]|nr:TerB family tellurite resistance protein [Halofilum sp. (in: g-proteobacteria)]
MLSRIQDYFRERLAPEADDDPVHRRHLAAGALLIEIARADFEFDEHEQAAIRSVLHDTLALESAEIDELVRLAAEESRDATSLHQFTHLVNESHSLEQKRRLMEDLWRVAYADGRIDKYEEQLLRRIADLIHLRHPEFMKAKHAVAPSA